MIFNEKIEDDAAKLCHIKHLVRDIALFVSGVKNKSPCTGLLREATLEGSVGRGGLIVG